MRRAEVVIFLTLTNPWLDHPQPSGTMAEPGFTERLRYALAGQIFSGIDDCKRSVFEFLPLPWLRTFRQTKKWFAAGCSAAPAERVGLGQQLSAHWITILTGCALLAAIGVLDYVTGPRVSMGNFYLAPIALLTLVVNRGWGTLAAVVSAGTLSLVRFAEAPGLDAYSLLAWNYLMRFAFLQAFVFLLDRVRTETSHKCAEYAVPPFEVPSEQEP